MILLKFLFILTTLFVRIDVIKCDLSLFPNEAIDFDVNAANFKYNPELKDGKLNIFHTKECPEVRDCDRSLIDKESFCLDHCSLKLSMFHEQCYKKDDESLKEKQNATDESKETVSSTAKLINSEGFLFYYRQFVHSLLDEIKHEELNGEQSNFDIQIRLSMYEINKLKQFANALDNSEASKSIQEATDILKNMFSHIQYFKPDEFTEMVSKVVISVAQDPRVQIGLVLTIIVISMTTILFNQVRKHKFSIKSLVVTLFILSFVISVVNNHFLIIQKNQIFKNQKLSEKIPDECFGTGFTSTKEEKNTNIFSSTLSQINGYFKLKPTSQVCLEYQEALLLDSKHANFVESIVFTITESIRPVAILFGESINLFYSSLTKNLSFYQYMPLMTVVTIIIVPVSIYIVSLLSLVLFGYEFNFFHLISFKKNNNAEQLAQQTELLKILSVLKKENEVIAQEMIRSREDQQKNSLPGITQGVRDLTLSTSSDIVPIMTFRSVEDSHYYEKKPDPYYTEPILEQEKEKTHETSLNESLCEEAVKYVNNTSKIQTKLREVKEKNDVLAYENKKLKEMIFYHKANQSITEDNNDEENKENRAVNYVNSNTVFIGNSRAVKKFGTPRSLKNSYVKDICDNDFGDDDEDIVVILDEK